ncbi:MAG: hypothetical protein IKA76_09090 [Clostridia bacterium]|nr:hypothetical protein [Clostridia bacterium]
MKKQAIQFLCVVLFFGILLSMTLYLGIGMLSPTDKGEEKTGYDVNYALSEHQGIQKFVRYIDYKIFRHIEDRSVVVGKKNWLFETVDPYSGFDYLLDYVNGCPYTEEEMKRIGDRLAEKEAAYAARGVEYRMVVIPSTYTACGEFLPNYLGEPSESTRLSVLSNYLKEREISTFIDLSEEMAETDAQNARYHNTEDSINAYGGFTVYDTLMTSLAQNHASLSDYRLAFEDIEFTVRRTDGKQIARRVSLESVVPNHTVSLTNQLDDVYFMTDTTEHCVSSHMEEGFEGSDLSVLVECSREWDKIQLIPYFSSTFRQVTYENQMTDGKISVVRHSPDVYIQIIHEGELDLLLAE